MKPITKPKRKKETKPRKPGGGRKPLSPNDETTGGIFFRATRTEKEELIKEAMRNGKSLSAFVRSRVLK